MTDLGTPLDLTTATTTTLDLATGTDATPKVLLDLAPAIAAAEAVASLPSAEGGAADPLTPPSNGSNPPRNAIRLRQHQLDALKNLQICLLAGKSRLILQMPTGAGKTAVASNLAKFSLGQFKRFSFCVPALSLVDQTFDRFVADGIPAEDIGIIQADHPWRRPKAPIQIATAQTLSRREIPSSEIVIFDEAHVRFAIYDKWMQLPEARDTVFIGLTATPWSKGLGRYYQDLIQPTSIQDLIEKGYLSPFKVFAPSHPDLKGVKTVAGDFHEGQLGDRMSDSQLVADVVSTWLLRGQNQPTLCFACTRAHAKLLNEQFLASGVPCAYIDAFTPREERNEIGRMLAEGSVKVVTNVGCLTTGIDWDVRCLILARPTKSEILFTQIIGRALRPAPGKEHAIILDHSDSHLNLGMVTDINYTHLDRSKPGARSTEDRKREKQLPLPKECPCCHALMPISHLTCLECGTTIRPPVNITVAEGELQEFRSKKKSMSSIEMLRQQDPHKIFRQIRWVQMERERKDGWSAHTFKDIYGKWPWFDKSEQPLPPSPELLSHVRGKDFRYVRFVNSRGGKHYAA